MGLRSKFNTSEPGLWLSGFSHVALIAAGLFAYSAPSFPEADEGIPVEVITENQLSQITKGETSAKKVEVTPKPRADRVADKVEERDPGEAKIDAPAPPKRPAEVKLDEKAEDVAADPPPPPARDAAAEAQREEARKLIEKAEAEALAQKVAASKAEAEAKAKAEAEAKAKAEEAKKVADAKAKAEGRSESQG